LPEIRVASGTALDGAATWCVAQVLLRERHGFQADLESIAVRTNVPASVLLPAFRQTQEAGYLTGDASGWHATDAARQEWAVFSTELKTWLLTRLGSRDDTGADLARLEETLHGLADRFLHEEASSSMNPADRELESA
jgi:hypothetical protein